MAGVNFGSTGTYTPYGGEAIFWNPRTDAGNNTIITGNGNDYVAAGLGGNDVVDLGTGDDIFDGAVRDISGTTGNDIINAGAGNDIIYAWGAGNKTVNGETGNDTISIRGFGNTIVNGGEGNDRIEIIDGAQLSNVTGGVDRHVISAGVGDDTTLVSSEDDIFTVDAGSGNDFIDIGSSNGTFDAGDGNDDIFALFANGNKISAGAGNDLIVLDASASTGNVVFGGTGDDTIVTIPIFGFDPNGPALGQHEIHGGAGNDTIFSGIGNDTIYDDAGDDIINLRGGFVNLRGQLTGASYFGTDKVEVKGGGIDTLYLGAGKDTVMLAKEGKATIYGFTAIDKLDLGGIGVTLSRNLQGDTLVTTNDSQQLQLATLVGYGDQVSII